MFAKLGGRPYEAEIYRRMADVYFDQTKHPEAIEAYRLVLQKDPLNKDAPQIQQRIVQAYERDRKLEEAFAESSKLANMFVPGTPWHEKWKRDPDIVLAAAEMAESSLYRTAIYHHQQALAYKQEQKFELAKAAFETKAQPNLETSSDVLTLNVGGVCMSVLRHTLNTVEGSMLAARFSGRWDDSLDKVRP